MIRRLRNRLAARPADEYFGRSLEQPVSPKDGLIIGRVLVASVLALVVYSFDDGTTSRNLALLLLFVALVQPALPLLGRDQAAFRQVHVSADLLTFVVVVLVAPEYFWLGVIAAASIVANYAVLTPIRHFVPVAIFSVVAILVVGWQGDVDGYERAAAVAAVFALGYAYLGFRTRKSIGAARADLLHAISAAGGFAYLCDLETGVVTDVAGDVERVVGWDPDFWMATNHRNLIHPDDLDGYWIDFDAATVGDQVDRRARFRRPDGSWVWIRDLSRVVNIEGRRSLRGFSIDVSSEQDGLAKVTSEAGTDELTGLPNRRTLLTELAEREQTLGHHLVLIDLNRFKDVNDTLGHDAGDDLLVIVAERLSACLRPTDVLARLGGDEFAIVMEGADSTTSVTNAVKRFAFEVARPIEISGVLVTVSISAGIVRATAGSSDPLTMLRHADISMYSAKRRAITSVEFDGALENETDRQAALATSLADALESNALQLQFQPIVDAQTGRVAGVEGLARWDHADFGMLSPSMFLDVVLMSERSGDFTRRMVLYGIAAAARLVEAGHDVPVSVNLPVRVLEDRALSRFVADSCASHGISPDRLVFEIAERDIHDTASITAAIDRMVEIGATISVDDFGAGHATFERLRWGNVDQLKLDDEAIRHAVERPRDRAILKSVLALARELGYSVVAEGVETQAQLDLLKSFGCPLVQGYLFAEAMPLAQFVEFADARRLDA